MTAYRERAEHAWTAASVRLMNTPSDFAAAALLYVQEVGHFEALPAYFTERENLDSYLVVYTVSGKGRLTYNNRTYTLLPGQGFYIHCMDYQYYCAYPGCEWELLWVHFHGVSSDAYYRRFAERADPILPSGNPSLMPTLLHQLIGLHQSKSIRNELLASRLLLEMITELLTGDEPTAAESPIPALAMKVRQVLDNQYASKISLTDLARSFAVNKYHLAKVFKSSTGLSPGEYLINKRITEAKSLLQASDLPVSQIAEKVGIDNVSHFINLFKARTGQTPLVFRKYWRNTRA